MYILSTTNQFERDYRLCKKRGYEMELLNTIIVLLAEKGKLPAQYKPHKLAGNYRGFWECHIQPDWLLIWLQNDTKNTIEFTRTGTHADLF